MAAVTAYVLDGYPPPPELSTAMDYRAWGSDVTRMRAGVIPTLNAAYNTYNKVSAWQRGGSEWTRKDKKGWEFVSALLAERYERRKAGTWPEPDKH